MTKKRNGEGVTWSGVVILNKSSVSTNARNAGSAVTSLRNELLLLQLTSNPPGTLDCTKTEFSSRGINKCTPPRSVISSVWHLTHWLVETPPWGKKKNHPGERRVFNSNEPWLASAKVFKSRNWTFYFPTGAGEQWGPSHQWQNVLCEHTTSTNTPNPHPWTHQSFVLSPPKEADRAEEAGVMTPGGAWFHLAGVQIHLDSAIGCENVFITGLMLISHPSFHGHDISDGMAGRKCLTTL